MHTAEVPIVARGSPRRPARGGAVPCAVLLLGLLGAACNPTPSAAPSFGAPTGPPSGSPAPPSAGAAATAAACFDDVLPAAPPWRDRVFYEVFVRSFGDSDGDGVGDLTGLADHLDYLNDGNAATTGDLGVTGIWLMPVAKAASYHGYDTIDYTAIEPDYGDRPAFKSLVAAAHARGISVIVDFVINHTSSDHPWFKDALAGGPHRDWYIWSETDPGWPAVAGGNPWHRTAAGDYYYGAFWEGMPDLNLRNPDVTAELTRIAGVWLDELGVDGFRIDAAKHLIEDDAAHQINTPETKAWLATFRDAIHASHPDAVVVGEVWDARGVSAGYTANGSLDVAFDFGVGPALTTGAFGDAGTMQASLGEVSERYAPGAAGTFLSNHDQPRTMTQVRGDAGAAKLAAAALLLGPGIPFVYYGEELGMVGTKPDERIRTPFPWAAKAPGYGFTAGSPWEAFGDGAGEANVEVEATSADSLLATYRGLIQLRDAQPALALGTYTRVKSSSRTVAASIRAYGSQRLLVIQNLSREPAIDVTLDLEAGPLCGTPAQQLLYTSDDRPATLNLAPLAVTAGGGFAGYVPVAEIPGRYTLVLDLSPTSP